jgi:hypothetical protein
MDLLCIAKVISGHPLQHPNLVLLHFINCYKDALELFRAQREITNIDSNRPLLFRPPL